MNGKDIEICARGINQNFQEDLRDFKEEDYDFTEIFKEFFD